MPDFAKIRLDAPVKAEFEFRGELKRVEIDGHFEVVVPTVSKADTTHVATLMHDRKRLEYRLIDGRLFRPILEADFQTWKLGDKRGPKPLVVNGASLRSLNYYKDSPLLGSPWLDWEPKSEEASEAMRARPRRAAPQAWEDAERRLIVDIFTPWTPYPFVFSSDVAGEVVQVGAGVTRFSAGDRVVGFAAGSDNSRNRAAEGAFQDYVVLLAHMASPIPESMTFADAAVLPLGFSTAACGLFQKDFLAMMRRRRR